METLDAVKALIPDYAKDVRLSIDMVLARSTLPPKEAWGCALAAAFTTGNATLGKAFQEGGVLDDNEVAAARTAGALMGMTNIWYGYLDLAGDAELARQQAGLRMLAYGTHGGVDERSFELWTLAASIVGKCKGCVQAHVERLKTLGGTVADLREAGRIAAVVNAAAKVLAAEGKP